MTFGDYVRLLRTYWKSILLVTVIGVGASIGVTLALPPTYTATSQVLFTPVCTGCNGQDLAFSAQYTQSRMVAYQSLVKTPQVLGLVVSTLDLNETPTKLADKVSAEFTPTSTILTINVEDRNAAVAARIARGVSQSLINGVAVFEAQQDPTLKTADKTVARVSGKLVTDPADPTKPSSPNLQLDLVAGLLLGLIIAIAQAGIRQYRASTIPGEPAPVAATPPPIASPWSRTPTTPEVAPVTLPAPPRSTSAKPQKRPGKRTRR